jgi:hypothetical protein
LSPNRRFSSGENPVFKGIGGFEELEESPVRWAEALEEVETRSRKVLEKSDQENCFTRMNMFSIGP